MGAMDEDTALMLRAKHGDAEAMNHLATKYRSLLLHYFHRRVGDYALAEDLTQDVFLRIYRYRERYEPSAKFSTWLYPIATHVACNWMRDSRRERTYERLDERPTDQRPREYPDQQPGIEERMIRRTRSNVVRHAVNALPSRQRTAVVMHKFEGVGCRQIAVSLQCTPQAVRSMLVRAYESIRVSVTQVEGW